MPWNAGEALGGDLVASWRVAPRLPYTCDDIGDDIGDDISFYTRVFSW